MSQSDDDTKFVNIYKEKYRVFCLDCTGTGYIYKHKKQGPKLEAVIFSELKQCRYANKFYLYNLLKAIGKEFVCLPLTTRITKVLNIFCFRFLKD